MAKRGSRGKRGKTDGGSTGGLVGLSLVDLQRELRKRETYLKRLHGKRTRLLTALRSVEAEIAGLGGLPRAGEGGVRRRARNETNLVEALAAALNGRTMSVTEVAAEVQRQGYVTTSPNFRTIVNQTLINSGKFKRTGRGQYTSKA